MSGGTVKVDPAVLRSAGTSFGQAAGAVGSLQADTPLSEQGPIRCGRRDRGGVRPAPVRSARISGPRRAGTEARSGRRRCDQEHR